MLRLREELSAVTAERDRLLQVGAPRSTAPARVPPSPAPPLPGLPAAGKVLRARGSTQAAVSQQAACLKPAGQLAPQRVPSSVPREGPACSPTPRLSRAPCPAPLPLPRPRPLQELQQVSSTPRVFDMEGDLPLRRPFGALRLQ